MQVRASKHNADESLRTRRCQEARLNIWNSYHCSMIIFSMMMLISMMLIETPRTKTTMKYDMTAIMFASLAVNFRPKWNLASSLSSLARLCRSRSSMAACTGNRFDSMNCGCSPDILTDRLELSFGYLENLDIWKMCILKYTLCWISGYMYLDFRFEIVWINCSYWNTFTLGPWKIIYEEDGTHYT